MDTANTLIVVAAIWLLTGLLLGFMMRSRGHEFFVWLVLGSIMGPLAIPLAFANIRREPKITAENLTRSVTAGDHDVMVALDGSDESLEALQRALPVVVSSATSVTLVTVLDFESFDSPLAVERRDEAQEMLEQAKASVPVEDVTTEILFGNASRVLVDYAKETGKDVIVLGAVGHGASKAVFGSVATAVVKQSPIPVVVGPRPMPQRLPYMSPD